LIGKEITPLFYENYENLDREAKYAMVFHKSLQLIEFAKSHGVDNYMEYTYLIGYTLFLSLSLCPFPHSL
jgi:hypothetical protein